MMTNIKEGDILRKKRPGASDELLRVTAVCPEEKIVRVTGGAGYDWEMPDGERKHWQHIPCGDNK